jgi:hypothetical protein
MFRRIEICGAMLPVLFLLGACSPRDISYSADVRPILEKYCLDCHVPGGAGHAASGFDMSSYESLMKGGNFGPFVIPGDPLTSTLNMLVEGRADPSIRMPHGRGALTEDEIETLRVWVQQGARNN